MEIVEGRLYTFNFVVEGQGFSFAIMADNQTDACGTLQRRLAAVQDELYKALNSKKSGAAN